MDGTAYCKGQDVCQRETEETMAFNRIMRGNHTHADLRQNQTHHHKEVFFGGFH